MIFVPVGILQGPKKIICQGRGGRGVGGIGILHSYGATEPPHVSFIVNQHSSEQGRVG